ncbi:Xaa-Pro aminopeptidase [Loktanella ponticola]|uniref:Xaa-Pro aminopeptidase n=1 Tax=Yoonia ponticola TaxID=1524255 RepID=A0A7W9BM25_9RHOB|nr:aminopeptidase P family protein [Yoonia ponticola]MBB5722821.1 Xaa-Pro aminopeptidase [Yoonia ponticola]
MFQTFDVSSTPEQGPARLSALRPELKDIGVDGFLVPRADVHQGEYVAPRDARLEWLTGFSGSAGFCAVLPDVAGMFIDGRYRLQVRSQVADVFTPVHWPEVQLGDWLRENAAAKAVIGFDPWLHTVADIDAHREALSDTQITLAPIANAVDQIWTDQPPAPMAPFTAHPLQLSGEEHARKRARLAKDLKADACILTLPDSIAWLLNIRGTDIKRNPVPHAFAILEKSGRVALFARAGKADAIAEHLGADVQVHGWDAFDGYVAALKGSVQIDPKSCPYAIKPLITNAKLIEAADPCSLPKACKNPVEIQGSRDAHIRDAVAMVRFLAWVDAEAPSGNLTEIDVVKSLEGFRRDTNALRDISFETISGAGPNGAIVHYRVSEDSNREVKTGELLLVDSGGQYQDGTTDITRTMIVGEPSDEHRVCYTRVLRGMIAVSMARFPKGVAGSHLDALARTPLWQAGQDYDHGTGHGVGSYLSVHEGPQGISRRATTPLEAGMILSNEPGYYREGAFGIRIENLIVVKQASPLPGADARDMLDFETLTHVPLDRRLIIADELSDAERDWIDQYHADTLRLLADRIDSTTKDWLIAACAPL